MFMGRKWKTSEASFQAMKFFPHRMDLVDRIHNAANPMAAATIGRDRTLPLREDWDSPFIRTNEHPDFDNLVDDGRGPSKVINLVKDWAMFGVVLSKFDQNESCQLVLLSTGESPIIESTVHDPYWGWGSSKTGVNRLGKILMAVRKIIRLNHVGSFKSSWST